MSSSTPIETLRRLLPDCLLPDQVRLGSRLAYALQQGRQGTRVSIPWERWLERAQASIAARARRGAILRDLSYPEELPICGERERIVAALRDHPVVVVAGETGSGKTTQLPKMCLEAGLGLRARIGCTQPRRVAALAIARRLAEELQVSYGREVGSKIRFSDRVRDETAVKVMTDGILLAEVQGDPLLTEYEALLVDEAHERSLNVDFLLGHLRNLLQRRDDLKVVITSATIDTERFARAFGGAPVIEVSGRLYPVEVRYRPPAVPDEDEEHEGETYLDAAVAAADEVLAESATGDVLIFMPGERDIREACDRIQRRQSGVVDVLPLFGRLSGAEQDAIFHPGPRRRVVVGTNIAETSLTVPRIRYVIDSGLARVSRYHAGTRCRRLPIEPIARSNADQRKGRCGRVAEGICVRLYAAADFDERPEYADPEIHRCNLADVVLRLKAFRLGEAETFPFIDPPPLAAIRGAYALLQELGALDAEKQLTPLGRELAQLPVDPAIGRMLLEARREGALAEVLVIAAGLSIQDPRERPLDQRDAAEAAHRRFHHAESDFLSLWNIWNAYHATWETLGTQSQLRKFCREHFLSFLRMREWVDLRGQLGEAMEDLGGVVRQEGGADYASIHRSLVAGLVGHVGQRRESNFYRLAGERQVCLFPGSGLFVKTRREPHRGQAQPRVRSGTLKPTQPGWVVAGEIVETTRSYARTAARIEPEWVLEVAPHVVRYSYVRPRWDSKSARVLVTEQALLRGLVLRERSVGWVGVDPVGATDLFIREALVARDLAGPYRFLEANDQVMQKIELWQTRLRQRVVPDLEEALVGFYRSRLTAVGSAQDLNRWLKRGGGEPGLTASPRDLLGANATAFEEGTLPDAVPVGDAEVSVRYAYAPGEQNDGVTFRLSVALAEVVQPELLDWAVPILREQRLLHLLRALPKSLRRPLMPLDATVRQILEQLDPGGGGFLGRISRFLLERHGVDIPVEAWAVDALPEHLKPRFEVMDSQRQTLAVGRQLPVLLAQVRQQVESSGDGVWEAAIGRWERNDLEDWTWGDLPEALVVGEVSGLAMKAYPGLLEARGAIHLRLFREPVEAIQATERGVPGLAERVMRREVIQLQQDLRDLRQHQLLYATLGSLDELLESGWQQIRQRLFPATAWAGLEEGRFRQYVARAREILPGAVTDLSAVVGQVLQKRHEALTCRHPLAGMRQRVDALVPPSFLSITPWERLKNLPRYLQALLRRAERAVVNPLKDREKQARVERYEQALSRLSARPGMEGRVLADFRWLLEEYKVSVFAQELGTAEKVSPRRLDALLPSG